MGLGEGRVQARRTKPRRDPVGPGGTGLRGGAAGRQVTGEPHGMRDGAPHFATRRLPHLPGDAGGTGGREQLWPHHPGGAQDAGECHLPFHVSGCVQWGQNVGFGVQRRPASSPGPGHTDQETPGCRAAGGLRGSMGRGRRTPSVFLRGTPSLSPRRGRDGGPERAGIHATRLRVTQLGDGRSRSPVFLHSPSSPRPAVALPAGPREPSLEAGAPEPQAGKEFFPRPQCFETFSLLLHDFVMFCFPFVPFVLLSA